MSASASVAAPPRPRPLRTDADRLAQLVADGMPVAAAGRRLGFSAALARDLWARICIAMGETP